MKQGIWIIALIALVVGGLRIAAAPTVAQAGGYPQITSFTSSTATVSRSQLNTGTLRIPVQWTTVNRPVFATLIFEQILPDGRVVNVELPRSTPWVNSNDRGMVAPVAVGEASQIVLRVRLYSAWLNRQYDERILTIGVIDTLTPSVVRFDSTTTAVERYLLPARSVYIPVGFAVSNRLPSQNLVFEQVMPDGRLLNVELPRSNPIIPASGEGTVRPYDPGTSATELRFRLTVYDINNGARLISRDLSIPISDAAAPEVVVVTGDACYLAPFPPLRWVLLGDTVAVRNSPDGLVVRNTSGQGGTVFATANNGDRLTLLEGPYCYYVTGTSPLNTSRQWRVRNLTQSYGEGWVNEYSGYDGGYTQFLAVDTTTPVSGALSASTYTTTEGGEITLNWNVSGVGGVHLQQTTPALYNMSTVVSGSLLGSNASYSLAVPRGIKSVTYTLLDANYQPLEPTLSVTISITCTHNALANTYPDICPSEASRPVQAAYQPFEGGFMVWHTNTIYVFYDSGIAYSFADTYAEGDAVTIAASSETAPASLYVPVRGFGKVWTTYPDVRNTLGWATAAEQGYTATIQQTNLAVSNAPYVFRLFITLPDGRTVSVANQSGGGSAYDWQ